MKRKAFGLLFAMLVFALSSGANSLGAAEEEFEGDLKGITWFNTGGMNYTMSDLKDQHTLVLYTEIRDVTANPNATCASPNWFSLNALDPILAEFENTKIRLMLVAVNQNDIKDKVDAFLKQQECPYPIGIGGKDSLMSFGAEQFPWIFIFNKKAQMEVYGSKANKNLRDAMVEYLRDHPELAGKYFENRLAECQKLDDDKKYGEAVIAYENFEKDFRDTKIGKEVQVKLDTMLKREEVKTALKDAGFEGSPDNLYDKATDAMGDRDYREALRLADKLAKDFPTSEANKKMQKHYKDLKALVWELDHQDE